MHGTHTISQTVSLIDHWERTPSTERTIFLDAIGIDGIRKAASLDLLRQLREQARIEKANLNPDTAITSLISKALSRIVSTPNLSGK
jgi:hypothetical protein